jgi:hypothetical protein
MTEWDETIDTKVVSVEVPAHVTNDDLRRALEVLASQNDDADPDVRRRFDRGHAAGGDE